MWLRDLYIHNFRKIETLTLTLSKGLTVLVGENNAGKTAIIDALRIILFSSRDYDSLRLSEDDFRLDSDYAPIEIYGRFTGLTEEDEVRFNECLVDVGQGKFEMQVNVRVEFNISTNRCNVKMWGGETEGSSLPSKHFDHLTSIYLQPLRDPERGLRPGQNSQISRLIACITSDEDHGKFEGIANSANEQIKVLTSVERATSSINSQMTSIAGGELNQNAELIFSDPVFRRIIGGLQPQIEGLPFALNGLGYNNLIFISTTLGMLQNSSQFSYRSILVEEPEAHLHPQLQVLLLRHLVNVTQSADAATENNGNNVQVITSSHSPILTSQAPIDSIVSVHEVEGQVHAVSIGTIDIDGKIKKKLRRYLDATRGELFFARRILMVEGIAEVLLMPELAKIAGVCLKDSAVSILNVDGINFNAFLPLFGEGKLSMPTVILTDGDAENIGDECSAAAKGLKNSEEGNLHVELSEITFEHELARSADMLSCMVQAFVELHPIKGALLRDQLAELETDDERANVFMRVFSETRVLKGGFAQELAAIVEEAQLPSIVIPKYILRAFSHLNLITLDANDDIIEQP